MPFIVHYHKLNDREKERELRKPISKRKQYKKIVKNVSKKEMRRLLVEHPHVDPEWDEYVDEDTGKTVKVLDVKGELGYARPTKEDMQEYWEQYHRDKDAWRRARAEDMKRDAPVVIREEVAPAAPIVPAMKEDAPAKKTAKKKTASK